MSNDTPSKEQKEMVSPALALPPLLARPTRPGVVLREAAPPPLAACNPRGGGLSGAAASESRNGGRSGAGGGRACPATTSTSTSSSSRRAQPATPKPFMRFIGLVPVRPATRRPRPVSAPASQEEGVTPALLGGCAAAAAAPPLPPPLTPPPLTRSDAAFLADGLEFVWGTEGLNLEDLNDLFEKVGFPRRDPARLGAALAHSHCVLWVRSTKGGRWARAGQLLGFSRTTSDGALAATVWDVAVSPAWQRGGLGRALVERLTARVVGAEGLPAVTLYAEPGVVGWYERCGFAADPGGAKGMAFQRTSEAGRGLVERALKRAGGG